jgi:hypothetical protein
MGFLERFASFGSHNLSFSQFASLEIWLKFNLSLWVGHFHYKLIWTVTSALFIEFSKSRIYPGRTQLKYLAGVCSSVVTTNSFWTSLTTCSSHNLFYFHNSFFKIVWYLLSTYKFSFDLTASAKRSLNNCIIFSSRSSTISCHISTPLNMI